MALLSWFSSTAVAESEEPPRPKNLTFDDIASQLVYYKVQYEAAVKTLEETHSELAARRREVDSLQKSIHRERAENGSLLKQVQAAKQNKRDVQKELLVLRSTIERQNVQLSQLRRSYDSLTEHSLKLGEKAEDAQLELEFLKCISSSTKEDKKSPEAVMPLIPQPFVVVLVDGDAYSVSVTVICGPHKTNGFASGRLIYLCARTVRLQAFKLPLVSGTKPRDMCSRIQAFRLPARSLLGSSSIHLARGRALTRAASDISSRCCRLSKSTSVRLCPCSILWM